MNRRMAIVVCIVAGLLCAVAATWEITGNLRLLRTWKRVPAVVTGTADPREIEVSVGPLEDAVRINVPVHPASMYSNWDHVTMFENPMNSTERRIAGVMDLWQRALAFGVAALLLFGSASFVRRLPPSQAVWNRGAWVGGPIFPAPSLAQVRMPGEAWKANLFWGAILGGSLLAAAAFGNNTIEMVRVFLGWTGTAFAVWMLYSAAANYTGTLSVTDSGLEAENRWSRKRVPWSELREIKLVDTSAELDKLKGLGARGRMKPTDNAVPTMRHWVFFDRDCCEVLRIDVEAEPATQLQNLLNIARQRLANTAPCLD